MAYFAETVTTAERVTLSGFTAAVRVIVALFEPDVLLTVSHVWSLLAVQFVLELMVKLAVLAAVSAIFNVLDETVNVVARLLASCSAVESSETPIAGSVIVESLHEKLMMDTRMIVVNKRILFIFFFDLKDS